MAMPGDQETSQIGTQAARYGAVGIINTAIDFAVTNLLVWMTGVMRPMALFVISLIACSVATLNSYWMNSRWTFARAHRKPSNNVLAHFFGVTLFAMLVNTSVFLFAFQQIQENLSLAPMLALNIAKCVGVASAVVVAFLGMRISVFRPARIEGFRDRFRFESLGGSWSFPVQMWVILLGAVIARAIYLSLTTSVRGDAVNYGWIASYISEGRWEQIDKGWYNPFCYWQALFYLMGFGNISAAIASSLIPGVLLVVPVTWLARHLYGERVAWLAGGITAFHPRLVEYSCNGYSESFYLLALTVAVVIWTVSLQKQIRHIALVAAGALIGLYFGVRNEAIAFLALCLTGTWAVLWWQRRNPEPLQRSLWELAPWRSTASIILGFALFCGLYCGVSQAYLGHSGIFKRTSVLAKRYSEALDPMESAREVYGSKRLKEGESWSQELSLEQIGYLIERLPRNMLLTLKTLPGVLLSPLWLFALLLPLFAHVGSRTRWIQWPLIAMLVFPFCVYPLLHLEPRYLLAVLVPIHIFGAAGLVAFCCFVGDRGMRALLFPVATTGLLASSLLIVGWRGYQLERRYQVNRDLAEWISVHVGDNDKLIGCGYGFVSTTGFLAKRQTVSRLWDDNPGNIVDFVRENKQKWLVLYESFLRTSNPELLPTLEGGVPGMELAFEALDHNQQRVQVYRLKDSRVAEIDEEAKPIRGNK